MLENLFARYGSRVTYDGKRLSAYWPPEAIHQAGEEELRALKVGYRAKSLKRQAQAFAPGELDEFQLRTLPAPELKAALLRLYGVGPASVWYLLFGVFKRYDAFEHISPWEQKIYSRLLFNQELVDSQTILAEVDARWGEWKMLAAHYLFEDLFWQRQSGHIPWLEKLIRL
jgi:3-methyladenine DNA glycosylase/8-oxoguanine DNA glycosylase